MKRLLLILVLLAIAAGSYVFATSPELRNMIEREPPQIEVSGLPGGIGATRATATVLLRDGGAGLATFSASVVQGDKTKALQAESFETPLGEKSIELELPGREAGFNEGEATLRLETRDASLWRNHTQHTVELLIDYARPKVEVLTQQHIGAQGGAEFIAYRATDTNLIDHGVKVSDYFAPGIPLADLDPSFAGQKDVYGVVFPIPLGFDSSTQPMAAVARDKAGNVTEIPLRFRIRPKRQAKVNPKLSERFVRDKVFLLIPGYEAMSGKRLSTDASTPEEYAQIFKTINEDYRRLLNEKLNKFSAASPATWYWKGPFIKPLASATSSTFGEERSYFFNEIPAGGSRHDGLDLASVANDQVAAANDGVVVFSGELGIYGETVVIDHGGQLLTLYGHLASTLVNEGEKVTKGHKIGRTGETGLAGGDHLHFEIRIGPIPVDPVEWWDSHWIEDNITGKFEAVKERLGMTTAAEAE